MPLLFPNTPIVGQNYSSGSSAIYQWNGTYWETVAPKLLTSASFAQTSSFAENVTPYIVTAYANATYTLPGGFTNDPCRYNVVDILLNIPIGWFNTSTYRFTPQKAGYWRITAAYDIYRGDNVEASIAITKNGAVQTGVGGFGTVAGITTRIIYLNGTTDYASGINSGGTASPSARPQYRERSFFQAEFISA